MATRLTENYSDANKDDVYAEIQARRAEREGKEGANTFEGINTGTTKDDMVSALDADDKATPTAGKSTEAAGVGTPEKPEGTPIPDEVKIKREPITEEGTEVTDSAKVAGNQSLLIIDNMQSRPVDVFLIDAKPARPGLEGTLVFVQGAVSSDLIPIAQARSKFACKADGTVIYNARGFDDVRPTADYDLVDIQKLIEHNHTSAE